MTCEDTGKRKLGNALEVPCIYKFIGTKKLVNLEAHEPSV